MALTTPGKNDLATRYAAQGVYAALFTADPGATGTATGEVSGGTYARVSFAWGTASNGAITGTATLNVPAGTTITYAAVCTSTSGATVYDRQTITSQNFATAGTFALTYTFTES